MKKDSILIDQRVF